MFEYLHHPLGADVGHVEDDVLGGDGESLDVSRAQGALQKLDEDRPPGGVVVQDHQGVGGQRLEGGEVHVLTLLHRVSAAPTKFLLSTDHTDLTGVTTCTF